MGYVERRCGFMDVAAKIKNRGKPPPKAEQAAQTGGTKKPTAPYESSP